MTDPNVDLLREYVSLLIETSGKVRQSFDDTVTRGKIGTFDADVPSSFRETKMVSRDGVPLIFYHGTRRDFEAFSEKFMNSSGTAVPTNYIGFFFTTSRDVAQVYISRAFEPKKGIAPGGRIGSYILDVRKPFYVTEKTYWKWNRGSRMEMEDLVSRLKSKGYDAIIMPAVWRGRSADAFDVVVFDSRQIHSVG